MIRNLLLVSVVGVVLYVALQPVPDNIEHPWKLKIMSIAFKAGFRLAPYTPARIKNVLDNGSRETWRATGPNVTYTNTAFDGVPVRVFADKQEGENAAQRPAIVFYHGGGWTVGHVDLFHSLTADMARNLDAVVVSVDYRLAPEYVFPVAIDDCTAATVSFLQRVADFNVDPARVAVMGDSAGGNLAAAVAQRLTFDQKYKNLPKLKLQVLIYPCLQAFDFQTSSYQQNGHYSMFVPDRMWMAEFWALYFNNRPSLKTAMSVNQHTSASAKTSPLVKQCLSHDLVPAEFKTSYTEPPTDFGDEELYSELKDILFNPDFVPLMREDLRGLQKAYIMTVENDVLRDDGIMYAKRLEKAGVQVTWKHYKNGFHSMFSTKDGPFASSSGDLSLKEFYEFATKNL